MVVHVVDSVYSAIRCLDTLFLEVTFATQSGLVLRKGEALSHTPRFQKAQATPIKGFGTKTTPQNRQPNLFGSGVQAP